MSNFIDFFDGDFTFLVLILLIILSAIITELFDLFKVFVSNKTLPCIKYKITKIRQRKVNNRKAEQSSAVNEAVLKVIEKDKHNKANSDWNRISRMYM